MGQYLFLLGAGFAGALMNALAGGGSFATLPALIASGLPSVEANASSTVALWPGGAASAWTYHEGRQPICGIPMGPMLVITLAGGFAGSLLLLWTPSSSFNTILPWLLLLATLALAFGRRIRPALQNRLHGRRGPVALIQFALGVYGGYFGGAVGLMMVAAWSALGEQEIKALNGPRTLLVSAANTIAVMTFALAGAVRWPETLTMLVGGLAGGIAGARIGRTIPANVARVATLAWTAAITLLFFVRAYAG
jgi:uncharacterized membrane protein YfcA